MRISLIFLVFFISIPLTASPKGTPQPSILLDSLVGSALVQRAGQLDWQPVKQGGRLHNNDIIRIAGKSLGRLVWADGSSMYLRANSQAMINLSDNTTRNIISRHVTVFAGAVYFLIKETLPRGVVGRQDTKIYTPTATLAIRGTSFLVEIVDSAGQTEVSVLNGTVMVGNILRKEQIFLAAGYSTSIRLNDQPVQPAAILTPVIDSLKGWVPPPVVDLELKHQLDKARRDYYVITGKLEDKLVIMPFTNETDYRGSWDIARALPRQLADHFNRIISGQTTETADTSVDDVIAFGAQRKARFVLCGQIRSFEIMQTAEISAQADDYKESSVARLRYALQLIDVTRSRQIFETEVAGEIRDRNISENSLREIEKTPLDLSDTNFSKTIVAQALIQTLDQAYGRISGYLKQ